MKTILLLVATMTIITPTAGASAETPAPPDAVRLQLAREILNATGGADAMAARMRGMFGSIQKLTRTSMSDTDPRSAALADSLMKYVVDQEVEAIPRLIDQTAAIYADQLSEQELRDMLAWTLSPSGHTIQAKMPVISQQLIASQGPLLKKIISGATMNAIQQVCADAKCTDDERHMVTAIAEKSFPPS